MTKLSSQWEHLKGSSVIKNDFLDKTLFGSFVEAWGRKNSKGKYDTIIGVYYRKEVKFPQGIVYVFEDVEYGKNRIHIIAEKIKREDSDGKPILNRDKGTRIGKANTPSEAKEIGMEYLEN